MQRDFFYACKNNDRITVKELVNKVDINYIDPISKQTPLIAACISGSVDVIEILLKQPSIDVNIETTDPEFANAILTRCYLMQSNEIVKLLCQVKNIDLTKTDRTNATPLWWACCWGKIEIVKCLIASGKDLAVEKTTNEKSVYISWRNKTAVQIAKTNKYDESNNECVKLVELYIKSPFDTVYDLQNELGWQLTQTPESIIFYHIIFLSDGFYSIKPDQSRSKSKSKFKNDIWQFLVSLVDKN